MPKPAKPPYRVPSMVEIAAIPHKCEAEWGYVGTVLWRLALAGKLAAGVDAAEIVAKELSLSGVQRPLPRGLLPDNAVEFFRFGEFAGWVIET